MDKRLTLGSLFDGSGGFPLGAILTGIEPLWASEIEPFPMRVTTKRLPQMKHLGDINKINGTKIPPVDIITAGFCCQDLSVAGKRAGLQGERSGLFFQMPRIIKEMRAATDYAYPKYAVLENVPGIYSSTGGVDFLEVLNDLIHIKDEALSIPMPEKGKWSTSGEIVGDGFSIGWRTLDAQFWGVAQRRRRCYIVVDFTGERAGEILFDETRLRGNPPQGGAAREAIAGGASVGSGNAIGFEPGAAARLGGHAWTELSGTLRADPGDNLPAVAYDERHPAMSIAGNVIDRSAKNGGNGLGVNMDKSFTLNTVDRHAVCYAMTTGCFTQVHEEKAPTLQARDYKDAPVVTERRYVVRRLTPTECAMLQGFPPDWCAGLETSEPTEADITWWSEVFETHRRIIGTSTKPRSRNQIVKWLKNPRSDAAEYKMWGNGVALPCVVFVLDGLVRAAGRS